MTKSSAFISVHLRSFVVVLFVSACGVLQTTDCFPQALRPGRLSKEETAALRPGLRLEFAAKADANARDARISRLAALYVPQGAPPTPFLPPGEYQATFSGYLKAPLKGAHAFYVDASGPVTLTVNDTLVLEHTSAEPVTRRIDDVALVKGYNRVQIVTTVSHRQENRLRVRWSGSDFAEEPLPADALFTRGDEPLVVQTAELRYGRELFATRGCTKCHALTSSQTRPGEDAMPELAWQAPSLEGVGSRLNEAWLRKWILEPKSLRPSATMPKVLRGSEAEQAQAAADIAAYLSSLEGQSLDAPQHNDEQIAEGVKLFENLGCVACHSTKPLDEEDPFARLSLHYVSAKFAPGQLLAFLKSPHKHYAFSRMPDFKLSDEEAQAISALLSTRAKGEVMLPHDAPQGDATRGKALFGSAGCAACHSDASGREAPKSAPVSLKQPSAGCLKDEASRAPNFALGDDERAALAVFVKHDLAQPTSSLLQDTAAEFSLRQVKSLNCVACHRRDGANSVLMSVLEEEGEQGLTPEVLPLLTWTGEKLKPAWTEKLLAGHHDVRARPWLRARMPAFPARAKGLAVGLSHEHGFAAEENVVPPPDAELAKVGAQLVGDDNGFSCIKCHAIGKRPPLAPFEAPGINLVSAAERLRYTYYPRWMMDPPRVDVLTKMPKFAADGQTTGVTSVFDGHAAQQYEALWHYVQTLPAKEGR